MRPHYRSAPASAIEVIYGHVHQLSWPRAASKTVPVTILEVNA